MRRASWRISGRSMLTQAPEPRRISDWPLATAAISCVMGISSEPTLTRTRRENQSGRSASSVTSVVINGGSSA